MDVTIQPGALRGRVSAPPDKAIGHRAVLLAALAQGATTITPWPEAEDCRRTLEAIERLGASVQRRAGGVVIDGRGPEGLRESAQPLACGESGTTLRLLAGLAAGLPMRTRLDAAPSLQRRPMRRIVEPLTRMGAQIEGVPGPGGEVHPPLTIRGRRPLQAIRHELPVASAQVKTAILLAALSAEGPTTVIEPHPTRDHTERLLRRFGVPVEQRGLEVTIRPGTLASPGALRLPGDFSSAAFFLVAALCVPGSRLELADVGLNPTRTGLLRALERMGATIAVEPQDDAWEPRGILRAEAQPLRALELGAGEAPGLIDELPVLMAAAALARGTSRLRGLSELRVKETDRIRSMVSGLRALGASVRLVEPDGVEIDGGGLRGGRVESAGDHRTAMSLAVAALAAQGPTTILGAECVDKSFPGFFEALREAVAA